LSKGGADPKVKERGGPAEMERKSNFQRGEKVAVGDLGTFGGKTRQTFIKFFGESDLGSSEK